MEPNQLAPKKQTNFTLVFVILALAIVPIAIFLYPEFERGQILDDGIQAPGTIIKVVDTGHRYKDQPEIKVRVKIEPVDTAAYEAVTKMVISRDYIPQFQPGKRVRVRYDADDRTKFAIEASADELRP